MRPRAHAAAVETSRSRSSSKSISTVAISRPARMQSQADARTKGFACRRSSNATSGENLTPSREAAATATASVGPWTIPLTIICATDREASCPPIAARASSAAACSGTLRSMPKPTKRWQRVTSAVTALLRRRFPASAASTQASASMESGRAAINASSDKFPRARRCTLSAFGAPSIFVRSANSSSCSSSIITTNLSRLRRRFNSFCNPSSSHRQEFRRERNSAGASSRIRPSPSEIKSEHIDGALRRELVSAECARRPEQPAVSHCTQPRDCARSRAWLLALHEDFSFLVSGHHDYRGISDLQSVHRISYGSV